MKISAEPGTLFVRVDDEGLEALPAAASEIDHSQLLSLDHIGSGRAAHMGAETGKTNDALLFALAALHEPVTEVIATRSSADRLTQNAFIVGQRYAALIRPADHGEHLVTGVPSVYVPSVLARFISLGPRERRTEQVQMSAVDLGRLFEEHPGLRAAAWDQMPVPAAAWAWRLNLADAHDEEGATGRPEAEIVALDGEGGLLRATRLVAEDPGPRRLQFSPTDPIEVWTDLLVGLLGRSPASAGADSAMS